MGIRKAGRPSYTEFFEDIARWADMKTTTAIEKYYDAMYEVIVRELYHKGQVSLPYIGTLVCETMEEYYQRQKGPDGEYITYRVPERDMPVFTPDDDFVNDVNMQAVTKRGRKRVRRGEFTKRDYMRQLRAASCGIAKDLSEERRLRAQEDFKQKLAEKRKQHDNKVREEVEDE